MCLSPKSQSHPTALPAFNEPAGIRARQRLSPPVPVSISYLAPLGWPLRHQPGLHQLGEAPSAHGKKACGGCHFAVWLLEGTSPAGTRNSGLTYVQQCMPVMLNRYPRRLYLVLCAATRTHHTTSHPSPPWSDAYDGRPLALVLRYDTSALSRQIRLSIASSKIHKDTCPRLSPRTVYSPDHQNHKAQQLNTCTSNQTIYTTQSLTLELCYSSTQAIHSRPPSTYLHGTPPSTVVHNTNYQASHSFQQTLTMPAQRPSHLPPCPGPPPSRPLPPLPK